VVGDCNQFAHAAALAVADAPGKGPYNPLFIYGGTGLGKTHLLHAIGHRARQLDPSVRVLYVTGEQFTNEMIAALRQQDMPGFRNKFRTHTHLLLLDDVQFIGGKERTQEELFHTFEALRERGRQIVFTSDVPPRQIAGFEERLRSRCESGMLADMQRPDAETLVAIVHRKAGDRGLRLDPAAAAYIAERVRLSVRELEGLLNRLMVLQQMFPGTPDLAYVKAHLGATLGDGDRAPTPQLILDAVAAGCDLRAAELLGRQRTSHIARARQVAMFLCRKHTGLSFPALGRFFQRDHTTVQHGVEKVQAALPGDRELALLVQRLELALLR
jgi:chromosomal replication initiator protein